MSDIYLSLTETPSVVTLSQPVISSSVAATVTVGNTVTVALDANSLSALENVTVTVGAAVSVSNFPATQVVTGSVAVTTMPAISISSVSISNFPASQTVAGTVTANNLPVAIDGSGDSPTSGVPVAWYDSSSDAKRVVSENYALPVQIAGGAFTSVQPISGTVTANLAPQAKGPIVEIDSAIPADPKYMAVVGGAYSTGNEYRAIRLGSNGEIVVGSLPAISGTVTVSSLPASTVTVGAMPSGALTTRFGSVVTANLATLTSCVTNTSRKFLLVQNIATSTVTIGIGFAPTTTQGIQLTAGAGLTFDAFCPTGGVWWLSSSAGSNFSILEG
jgi:hypothetical protein